jgi:hypothetical protein
VSGKKLTTFRFPDALASRSQSSPSVAGEEAAAEEEAEEEEEEEGSSVVRCACGYVASTCSFEHLRHNT